ncbi:integral membrane protein [Catenulispora acidiphila DSM 44928]|uniref:Integral membrane protein n=1 Tax=Catenulispora acidiphila (strain DSM 44928 / JCM 14897 / NBRC 102108 / NRRL B-24433 / ID139908) TaxID=479433 RepID=C7Q427_CATAD|nr:MMPL family transporter [Catenulispora acidiphila]ACU69887.1 integral membrane protein [Catenulispora acidiphila DSM 44928]
MLRRAAELAIARPKTVVAVWVVVLMVGLGLGGSVFGKLGGLGAHVPGSESQVTADRLDKLDPGSDTIDGLVTSTTPGKVIAPNAALQGRVAAAVADLRRIPGVAQATDSVENPATTGDGQVVAIPVTFVSGISSHDENVAAKAAEARLRAIASPDFQVRVGGGPLISDALNNTAQSDASKAELISLPIVLLLLVVVFGGLLAASLPLVLAVCGVASTLLVLYGFSFTTDLSVYSVQITTMLGLGLGVDYALLMVTRFKQERVGTPDIADCVRQTVSAAGRTVFFSGLTVAVSLVGLVVYPAPFLRSMGLAATVVVAVDMLAAVTLLPALLAKFGHRIKPASPKRSEGRWFGQFAAGVARRPLPVLVVIAAGLVTVAAPVLSLTLSPGDARELPASSEARQVYDLSVAHFPGQSAANPLYVLVEGGATKPAYLTHLRSLPGVVDSAQKTYPDGSAVLQLTPAGTVNGKVATGLVQTIRGEHQGAYVTGDSAHLVDFRQMLVDRLPYATGVVLVSVFVLLFLFTGSVLIPLKAVLTNLLSIGASLGAMVWVFQQGHFAGLFGAGLKGGLGALDVTVPPLLIAVAFGLSMDYEIFILGRIREARLAGEPAREAVVTGVRHTGRVVTCAAALLVIVFACFMTGGAAPILEFGFGLTFAVLVDATLVRMLLVPAVLALLGERAWWAPRALRGVHERFGVAEAPEPVAEELLERV